MRRTLHGLRFQGKLLLPVLAIMVMLIIVTLWVVNDRITQQVRTEAAGNLTTAAAVFRNSQKIREKNLILRYGDVPNEPRFKAVARLAEAKTMQFRLNELIIALGADVIQFTSADGEPLAFFTALANIQINE